MDEQELEMIVEEQSVEEDTSAAGDSIASDMSELEALREEVNSLRAQLEEKTALAEKITAQIGEFAELFPEITPDSIPDSVWESVKSGSSLAAAYALYERRAFIKERRTNEVNQKNARLSTGKVGNSAAKEFFSPDEVRAMSQAEVRANYSKIVESMKKWN